MRIDPQNILSSKTTANGTPVPDSQPWLKRVGIINDYLRIPYANGSSYASQLLFRELNKRGKDVTVIGPHDPHAKVEDLPPGGVALQGLPLRNHPGVYLPFPTRKTLRALAGAKPDLVLAQATSGILYAGTYLRHRHGAALVCVNTVHLPSVYNVVLPERLHKVPSVVKFFEETVIPWVESHTVDLYNAGDGLIVLSPGLEKYWRDRGVKVPIHVIPRAIERKVFDRRGQADPFPAGAKRGHRLLVVCRHTREKNVTQLLRIFANEILPKAPETTLTLVGDGPDHEDFIEEAKALGLEDKAFFVGEQPLTQMPAWYEHADLFLYTSLSETYGQVVSEALWCGVPVVALDDGMGVAGQVTDGVDGYLIKPDLQDTDQRFAARVLEVMRNGALRARMSNHAVSLAQHRCDLPRCIDRYMKAFGEAKEHLDVTPSESRWRSTMRLGRWTWMHAIATFLGLLRPPAELNRNKAATGTWELTSEPEAEKKKAA